MWRNRSAQAFKYVFGVKVDSFMVPGVGSAGEVLRREEYMQRAYDIGLKLGSCGARNRKRIESI